MSGERMSLRPIFILVLLHLWAGEATAMLRFNVYRPEATIQDHEVCIVTKHEKNLKKVNQANPLNGQEPIACRISLEARAIDQHIFVLEPRSLRGNVVRRFDYDQKTKVCFSFADRLGATEKIDGFSSLQSECTTWEAGPRVFPGSFAQKVRSLTSPSRKKG